ncbi:MAG: beta-propeller domain-containing protein [Eubacterium sp.]
MKKKDTENFDFIKSRFDSENIGFPDELNEANVKRLLESNTESKNKIKFKARKTVKAAVSIAACFAVLITSLAVAYPNWKSNPEVIENEASSAVKTFSDYEEINTAVKKIKVHESADRVLYGYMEEKSAVDSTADSAGSSSYAQTYKQVDEVDEGDIIKNDGEYIYFASNNYTDTNSLPEIKIIKTDKEKAETVCVINDFADDNEYVCDIYVLNNILVANVCGYECKGNINIDYSKIYIYDISDRKNPKQINAFEQSGYYNTSRMIGNMLYVVSNYYVNSDNKELFVPYYRASNGERKKISATDIACVDNPQTASYVIISSIDISSGKMNTLPKAIFGAADNIYCNEDNMFVTNNQSVEFLYGDVVADASANDSKTQIIKLTLNNGKMKFTAAGEIDGYINDQFSIDEKDGYLRVASTTVVNEKESNNLFVLDESLKIVGRVTGFAKNESIQAVRFIKDKAYVITYEFTDPLFVIDLSNPENPEIQGSVKITGFSSLLVPVDDNTILGIGYESDEDGFTTEGIKLALFDISNSESPKVLDSKVIKNASSDAQYNHKALVVNPDKGYYAIPYYQYNDSWSEFKTGALVFEIDDNHINITNEFFEKNTVYYSRRCTYVDDYIYVLDENGSISAYLYQ